MEPQPPMPPASVGSIYVPVHIVGRIMLKARVKSLLRSCIACKLWNESLTDQMFMAKCRSKSESEGFVILRDNVGISNVCLSWCLGENIVEEITVLDFNLTEPLQQLQRFNPALVSSVDGILYFETTWNQAMRFLINPMTNEMLTLPTSDDIRELEGRRIRFSPGFGASTVTGLYKVVLVSTPSVFVYTLGTGLWRQLPSFPDHQVCSRGMTVGDAIYWDVALGLQYRGVIKFSLDTERFESVDYPDQYHHYSTELGMLDGKLCVSFVDKRQYYLGLLDTGNTWQILGPYVYTEARRLGLSVTRRLRNNDWQMVESGCSLVIGSSLGTTLQVPVEEDDTYYNLFSRAYEPSFRRLSAEFADEERLGHIQEIRRIL